MTLILRLALLYIRTTFSKPDTDLFKPHEMAFRVWITDHDMFNHMTNSRYFSITDIALMNWMIKTGIWRGVRKQDWTPMVVFKDAAYLKSLRFPERYTVQTKLQGWTDNYILWRHEFLNKTGERAAIVSTIGRIVARDKMHPSPDDLLERMGLDIGPSPDLAKIYKTRIECLEQER